MLWKLFLPLSLNDHFRHSNHNTHWKYIRLLSTLKCSPIASNHSIVGMIPKHFCSDLTKFKALFELYKIGKLATNCIWWLDSILCTEVWVFMAIFFIFFFGCFPYWEKLILYLHSIDTGSVFLSKTLVVVDDLIVLLCGCTRIMCMRHILLGIRNGFLHSLTFSLFLSLSFSLISFCVFDEQKRHI